MIWSVGLRLHLRLRDCSTRSGLRRLSGPGNEALVFRRRQLAKSFRGEESRLTFSPFLDPSRMLDFLNSNIWGRSGLGHGEEAFF